MPPAAARPLLQPAAWAPPLLPACRLPTITVTYQGLSVETDAAVGSAGIPTVARWLGGDQLAAAGRRLRALAGGSGADAASGSRTVLLSILQDVQGVLKPVGACMNGVLGPLLVAALLLPRRVPACCVLPCCVMRGTRPA